jgi:cleavage and polyadenylation specificity factor subunit 4
MPECNFFVRNGYCSNGEECLYLHVDPDSKLPKCPHYENGFCPLGPNCSKKHVRKPMICKFFLAGFCPDGSKACKEGGAHPKWTPPNQLPQPSLKRPREEPVGEEKERWEERRFGGGGGFGGGGRRRFFGRGR